jgi:hypothetical protein
MEIGNETLYETFRHKLTDTYDIVRIDDLGRQTVVDGGKEPRFRSTRTYFVERIQLIHPQRKETGMKEYIFWRRLSLWLDGGDLALKESEIG